jgi:hypothetical protein
MRARQAFHVGEASAYRSAGLTEKARAHERRARYYARFGDGEQALGWAEPAAGPECTDAEGTTWTKMADGSSCTVFETKYVAKIFRTPDAGMIKQEVSIVNALGDLAPSFGRYVHSPSGAVIGYTMERMHVALDEHMTKEVAKDRPALSEAMQKEVLGVIRGVCEHATCLDIKPANFALTRKGDVRMIDLGADFCAVSEKDDTYEARVRFCVLLFCTSVCTKGSDDRLLSLHVLLGLLLDERGDPLPEARAELEKIDNDELFATERLSENIRTGNCVGHFAKGKNPRIARVMNTGMLHPKALLDYLSDHVKAKRGAA